jgi:hypothetical protein
LLLSKTLAGGKEKAVNHTKATDTSAHMLMAIGSHMAKLTPKGKKYYNPLPERDTLCFLNNNSIK